MFHTHITHTHTSSIRLTYVQEILSVIFTFLFSCGRHMRILGLFLDAKIHIVLLHVQIYGSSWVTVHSWMDATDRCPLAGPSRAWTEGQDSEMQLKFINQIKPVASINKRFYESIQYILGMVNSVSSASCSVSLSSNLMSLNHDGSECPSRELTLSLSGEGVSENSVL